jgi:Pullulanase X25 domain
MRTQNRRTLRLISAAQIALCIAWALSFALTRTRGSDTPTPTRVTIPGSLESEITNNSCGDWDPACSAARLTFDADDQVWQGTFTVPAGDWEYKAALNDSWGENYGRPYRKVRLSFFSYTYRHPVLTVNLPLLTILLF